MAVSGLLGLLDDVSSMLSDPSLAERLAVEKAAKIAEDDITKNVRPGQSPDTRHEISVILEIAKGALKNKLLYIIPATFAVAVLAPAAVLPISIASGAYIGYEGFKKLADRTSHEQREKRRKELLDAHAEGKETLLRYERDRIAQAIKTDAALSLELIGFQLGMVAAAPVLTKLLLIGVASVAATTFLYGTLIGIVGMNGVACRLKRQEGEKPLDKVMRRTGNQLMRWSSPVMDSIAWIGMSAMFYVGGHLLLAYIPGAEHALHAAVAMVTHSPVGAAAMTTLGTAALGIGAGATAFGGVKKVLAPLADRLGMHVPGGRIDKMMNKVKKSSALLRYRLLDFFWVPPQLPAPVQQEPAPQREATPPEPPQQQPLDMRKIDTAFNMMAGAEEGPSCTLAQSKESGEEPAPVPEKIPAAVQPPSAPAASPG